ncbi:Arylsulfatase [Planctomycetes bacterium Pan216]|uniref:Arylsulfatase n=1 Tax=Kolteria novifilia TaxID=2527975 RepID=A0A518B360_9BACT|nr:Arylsulfatase [Planctomycetes bacterium Pan216]
MQRLLSSIVAIAIGSTFVTATKAGAEQPPSILFFFADDQRHDTLGCAGHPIVKTPTIDRLAAEGVRFNNAFVTTSICWVSRSTILTGLTARSFGTPTQPDAIKPEALGQLYPDLLRQAGYRTGFYGKWHAHTPKGFNPKDHYDEFEKISRNPYFKKQADGTERHTSELIGDGAVAFLESQPKDQPFCLNLWFNAAHAEDRDKRPGIGHYPWPKAVDGMYDDLTMAPPRLDDPAIYAGQPDFLKNSLNRERYFWRWDTPEKYQTNMRAYYRMISGIDGVIARVLETLRERGLADNTIVIYSADNGYYMGDRGFAGKWSHYEQSLRVPMIVVDPRLPKEKRGRVDERMVLNLDLPSTFLDWAGTTIPSEYQGESLAPLVAGEPTSDWRRDFFCEHVSLAPNITWEGIRGPRYVYARYFDQWPVYEFLHDLEKDPDQLTNFASNPAYASVLDTMRARCDEEVAVHGGPLAPIDERRSGVHRKKK